MNKPVPPSQPAPAVFPVIAESVVVQRQVETAGQLRVRIRATTVTEQVPLEQVVQQAHVERVAVGRPCAEREPARYESDVLVVPVYEEVVTISRQLVLKEELRVRLMNTTSSTVQAVDVRREEAIVERLQPDGSWVEVKDDQGNSETP